ncbi:MAG: rhodanese-like domain-containing protein [Pseudomonadota bacterium]
MNAPLSLPAEQRSDLVRAHALVSPQWLALGRGGACLLEVGCAQQAQFERLHISGAAYLDTGLLETPPLFNKVVDSALLAVLLGLGIRHDSTVILYGRNQLAAARAAHLMLYAGVRDVRLLDGGFGAWCAAALPCESGPAAPVAPCADFGAPFPGRPDFMLDSAQAARLAAGDDAVLASIRTWREFSGATSGYHYIAARGDIAGARWGRAGHEGDVNSMSEYQLADGRMRPAAEIGAMWRANGIHAGQQVGFYCGTGWRASLAFFYAWLMGWERIGVYDGGWYEWSGDPGNPVVCRIAEPMSA